VSGLLQYWWLTPVGFGLGALGTLVGAGGGFLLAPMLLLLYPAERPETIASISLAVVFLNALSGTVAYTRMRRVDYRSGLLLSAATVPGAILGAYTTTLLPVRTFHLLFAAVLILGAGLLLWRPHARTPLGTGAFHRTLTERDGTVHAWSYNPWLAATLSLGVGYVSSLLGIGGGIIHVPVLTAVLGFPVHVATATSHFALAVMAGTGTLTHVVQGAFHHGWRRAVMIGIGVLPGAQLGAMLSSRLHGRWILRVLAVALLFVAARLIAG
jgi:uncharacterized membrane protein YfcA